jgi:hypothetical protein
MSLSTTVLDDERVAHLERELQISRANEETSKAALQQLHQDLKEAYFKIARQQQRLDTLTKKLQTGRAATGPLPLLADVDQTAAKLVDLVHPYNLSRKFKLEEIKGENRPKVRKFPAPVGEAAARIQSLLGLLPSWPKGMISSVDAGFLDALITEVRPEGVYEVGVASGFSSAIILSSMATYADPARTWLHSYDIADYCYFDPTHAVGDATREVVPHLLKSWQLNLRTTALDAPGDKEPQTKSLYFIDANHSHPWPTLDLIALLPCLKTGDHVALHDINLPTISSGRFPDYGVQWLFENWLGERLVPDVAIPNIGAIVIPQDKTLILASLVKTLSKPWPLQVTVKTDHLHACEQSLMEFLRQNKLA